MHYKDNNNRFFHIYLAIIKIENMFLKKAFIDLCRARFTIDKLLK